MQVVVTGRNLAVPEELKEYIQKKLNKLDKYFHTPMEARVILGLEGKWHTAEMILDIRGAILKSQEKSHLLRAAVDRAFQKLRQQVKKYKEKLIEKSRQTLEEIHAKVSTGTILRELEIIRTNKFAVKPMTPEEAAKELEVLGQEFFVFLNSQTDEVNVIYKRKDGHYGLIEPEF